MDDTTGIEARAGEVALRATASEAGAIRIEAWRGGGAPPRGRGGAGGGGGAGPPPPNPRPAGPERQREVLRAVATERLSLRAAARVFGGERNTITDWRKRKRAACRP